MYGKQNLHDLNIISFFLTKKKSLDEFLSVKQKIEEIENTQISL